MAKPTNANGGHPMGGGRAAAARQEGNPRRALGDVGNLVGPLTARCSVNRNGIMPENQCDAMKNFCAVDRPVTRKFGATFANNHQLTQIVPAVEEHDENVTWRGKQRRTIAPTREICHSRREIQNPAISQQSQPCNNEIITRSRAALLKKENESMIEKQDTDMNVCCEVEMEDAEEEEPVPNIDEADAGNPMNVVDYVQDIYSFYRETEILSCVRPDYMSRQPDINDKMRAILIDWLIEVHCKFDLRPETLFLTINLLDRYLSSQSVVRKNLQLVGVTAMLLACKYEEVCVPVVEDFVLISDRAYTRDEVLQMERSMLNTLQFNLTLPTPYVFIKRFLKAANSDKELEMAASFFMELCLVEYVMLRYPPSMLAAAAVYIARCTLRRLPLWNRTLEYHTSYTEGRLQECAKLMVGFHQHAGLGRVTCVHRKYSTSKFNHAAKLEPALFIGNK